MEQPINILIVDDEPKNLTVLETVLGEPGYKLVRAESADQALLALVVEEFALLILDIRMPGMNGFELAELIKQRKKTAQVPIIFLTAYYNEDQHVLDGYVAGAVDYLPKPVNPSILRGKVAVFAELYRKQREAAAVNRALLNEVTDRRRAQEQLRELNETLEQRVVERTAALRESEERMRLAVDAAQMGSWDWNLSTDELLWSPRHETIFGFVPGMPNRTPADFKGRLHPSDAQRVESEMRDAISDRKDFQTEYRVVWDDRSVHWVYSSGTVHCDPQGQPIRLLGMIVDITAQKQAAEDLMRSKEAAEAANRAKDHFLAVLSHELRTPLTPVMAAVQILEADPSLADQHRELVQMVRRNAELETRLIDDLLDITRIANGKVELRSTGVSLHEIIRQVLEICHDDAANKQLRITTDLAANISHIDVDPARFQQVLWNVLKNAIKFTPEGGQIRISTFNDGTQRVVTRVRDSGIGIEADLLPHVFDAFEQGARSDIRQFGGLGLGLAIAKALVEMQGGTITAESEGAGKGATFTVEMPCRANVTADVRPAAALRKPKLNCSILLVEDHVDSRTMMTRILLNLGCRVKSAGTVAEALRVAEQNAFDLLISDIGLPDATGMDLMRQMASLYGLRGIALSGYGSDKDLANTSAAGFEAHLIKPVNVHILESTLRKLIVLDAAQSALE